MDHHGTLVIVPQLGVLDAYCSVSEANVEEARVGFGMDVDCLKSNG